jgi:ABC-type multidrug transport system fused ATPase/permease subunit
MELAAHYPSWIENIRRHLGRKGMYWAGIRMISSLILAGSEYLVALILIVFLFAMGLVEPSMLPGWFPVQSLKFSPWIIWGILVMVTLLRAGFQLVSRQSGHILLELVRARLKMAEAFRLLILERDTSLFISRLNTHMAEIIPRASDYVFAITGLVAASLHTAALAAGLAILAWRETLVGILCLGAAAGIISRINRTLKTIGARIPEQHRRFERILVRISRNWHLIRILNLNRREYRQYMDSVFDYFVASRDSFLLKNVAVAMPPLLGIIALALVILASLEFFHAQPLRLVAFVYLFVRFTQSLVQITDQFSSVSQYQSQFQKSSQLLASMSRDERIAALSAESHLTMFSEAKNGFSVHDAPPSPFTADGPDENALLPDVELKHVMFAWPGMSRPLFADLSLDIRAGSRFGIVGPNGCGKSTLLGIMLGVIRPDRGEVLLGKMDPGKYIKDHGLIGFVGEDPFLFAGTVRENLTYGLKHAVPDPDLWDILEKVGLRKVIGSAGKGLDYLIDENGGGLSTGEQQKLSLARALLRRPKLLILDEASSNIDSRSEIEISHVLKNCDHQCTMLIVSHKPGILNAAENIINLADPGKLRGEP